MTAARSRSFTLIAPLLLACGGSGYDPCPGKDCSTTGAFVPEKVDAGVSGRVAMAGAAGGSGESTVMAVDLTSCGALGTTVDEFETKFFAAKCGTMESGCHLGTTFGNFKTLPMHTRMTGKSTTFQCAGDKFINADDPAKSIINVAVQDSPVCPNGKPYDVTRRMPLGKDPLTAMERGCLLGYLKAVTGE